MTNRERQKMIIQGLRWIARIWSMALLALAIVESVNPDLARPVVWHEWLIPVFLYAGVLLGLLLTWRNEGVGGACFILGWFAGHVWTCVMRGACVSGNALILTALFFVTPGIIFIVSWSLTHIWEETDGDLYSSLYGY